ncbi:MAG: hypothetical protein AAB296_03410 [Candidatus Desantisbacteria bacterium]
MMKEDIYDIKNIISVFDWGSFLFLLALLAIIIFLAILGYFICKKLQIRKTTPEKKMPERPFNEVALEELNAISPLYYYERMLFKEYYCLITEIVRKFLSKKYFFDAMDKTSSEIIEKIEGKERDYEKVKLLDRYFQVCDMVKFAKYKPSLAQMCKGKEDSIGLIGLICPIRPIKPISPISPMR